MWVGFTQRSHSRKPPPLFLANRSLHLERLFTLVGLRNQWSSELPPSMKGCMTEGGQGQTLKADALDLKTKDTQKAQRSVKAFQDLQTISSAAHVRSTKTRTTFPQENHQQSAALTTRHSLFKKHYILYCDVQSIRLRHCGSCTISIGTLMSIHHRTMSLC